jgi:ADP-heptose:LPS heptosyltransferase
MAKQQADDRLPTKTLREVAKAVNRTNTNVITFQYSDDEAAHYVVDHWDHDL